jgi:hypothetical protein
MIVIQSSKLTHQSEVNIKRAQPNPDKTTCFWFHCRSVSGQEHEISRCCKLLFWMIARLGGVRG